MDCFRCLHFRQRSINVVQVYTNNLDKCFVDESRAAASCPTDTHIKYKDVTDLLLFRECQSENFLL